MKRAILGFILGIAITISLAGGYVGRDTTSWYTNNPKAMHNFIYNMDKKGYHVVEFEMITYGYVSEQNKLLFVIMEK